MNHITLSSDSLFSKWGFNDGDVLDDIIYDAENAGRLHRNGYGSHNGLAHDTLIELVKTELLPELPRRVETYEICSIHNPIRAAEHEVHDFTCVTVSVSYAKVIATARRLIDQARTKEEPDVAQETTLTCPDCGSDQVIVHEERAVMANTFEHYCHSVKAHDPDAKASCLKCNWAGERQHLKGQP